MGYIKNFTNFTASNEGVVSEETDVMFDETLTDLSKKIQYYKNQINQCEKAKLDREKVLATELKAKAAQVVTPAAPTQPATS